MPFIKRSAVAARIVASMAVASVLVLVSFSIEAAAKSKQPHARSHAAAISRARQSSAAGYPFGTGTRAEIPLSSRGVVSGNTAGWGNVGAP